MCRRLADGSSAAVLAIDYRLAPEHPWPASVDDTVAALRWVASGSAGLGPDGLGQAPTAVAVAGDSAGGTLAALGCLRLRDAGVAVELRREPGLIHGFMTLDEISPACAAAADRVAADLRAQLSRP